MKEILKSIKLGGTVTTPGDKGVASKPGAQITTPGTKGTAGKPGGESPWKPGGTSSAG